MGQFGCMHKISICVLRTYVRQSMFGINCTSVMAAYNVSVKTADNELTSSEYQKNH